ncbi:HPP family protein [Blastococcus sp. TF02-09]|uniref:HPP family protein n=1 Tax=Blastococcus sp. TF02-09 TaxID=2250576 RepID=UPI0011BF743C|nr:HPP family protein [Blastococcus sp. TF02-9]
MRTGTYAGLVSAIVLACAGVVGLVLHQPWLFPSLGPTLMVMTETPRQPAARPRNVIVGHAVGVAAGYLALVVTGLTGAPPVIRTGVNWQFVLAAALALGLTSFVLQAIDMPHPPAGATTLIVGLGLLNKPGELGVILLAVVLVTAGASAVNRLRGVRNQGEPVEQGPRQRP